MAKIFPSFKFVWLAEETKLNLPIELDFLNEAKNIEKIAKIFENFKFIKVGEKFRMIIFSLITNYTFRSYFKDS